MTKILLFLGAVCLAGLGCSDSHDDSGTDPHAEHAAGSGGTGGTSAGGTGGTETSGGAGGGGGAVEGAPLAPTLTELMPMTGALHVMWTNNDPACDTVEGERKSPTEDFKVVFTVPGEVDNKHDGTAIEPVEYTYRLRCKKGEQFSPYSPEMTGKPKG